MNKISETRIISYIILWYEITYRYQLFLMEAPKIKYI